MLTKRFLASLLCSGGIPGISCCSLCSTSDWIISKTEPLYYLCSQPPHLTPDFAYSLVCTCLWVFTLNQLLLLVEHTKLENDCKKWSAYLWVWLEIKMKNKVHVQKFFDGEGLIKFTPGGIQGLYWGAVGWIQVVPSLQTTHSDFFKADYHVQCLIWMCVES